MANGGNPINRITGRWFDPGIGRMRKIRRRSHSRYDALANQRGEWFRRGTIVVQTSYPNGFKGIVMSLDRTVFDGGPRSGSSAEVAEVAWHIGERRRPGRRPSTVGRTCVSSPSYLLDDLRPLGQATSPVLPYCNDFDGVEYSRWVPGREHRPAAPGTRRIPTRVELWAREAGELMQQLLVVETAELRQAIEARLVKLDHLMSIYEGER
jgi:hypothetical protein